MNESDMKPINGIKISAEWDPKGFLGWERALVRFSTTEFVTTNPVLVTSHILQTRSGNLKWCDGCAAGPRYIFHVGDDNVLCWFRCF